MTPAPRPGGRTVRDAAPADVRAIATIRVAAWRAAYRDLVPTSVLDRMDVDRNVAWFERFLAAGGARLLVVEEGGAIRGYVIVGPARDEDVADLGEVQAIYLDPAHRGRGLGPALLEAGATALGDAGVPAIVLWVLTDNVAARRFYERAGFRPDGTSRDLDFDGRTIQEVRYRRAVGPAVGPAAGPRNGPIALEPVPSGDAAAATPDAAPGP